MRTPPSPIQSLDAAVVYCDECMRVDTEHNPTHHFARLHRTMEIASPNWQPGYGTAPHCCCKCAARGV